MEPEELLEAKKLRSLLRLFAFTMIIIFVIAVKSSKDESVETKANQIETTRVDY